MKRILAIVVLSAALAGCVYAGPPRGYYYAAPGYHYVVPDDD